MAEEIRDTKGRGKNLKFSVILEIDNLAEKLDEGTLGAIAMKVEAITVADQLSRKKWIESRKDAMDLAMQVRKAKNTPWKGAANMKYPLLTTAAIQFAAGAIDSVLPGKEYVKATVNGKDEDGKKQERADRIALHMSWQLQFDMPNWESGHDRLLHILPIVDCCHKKTYFDVITGKNVSKLVLPRDLVINYWSDPDEQPMYATHLITLIRNQVMERINSGLYIEHKEILDSLVDREEVESFEQSDDKGDGIVEYDHITPELFYEQHGWLDLDGDGYKEPYIITLHKESSKIVRIVKRFEESGIEYQDNGKDIIRIEPHHYFTKYEMLPSLDGGYYGTGWGSLLSPTNRAFDTLVNQLLDAGTLNNRQGGFIGSGINIRGGDMSFTLGEFKRVDVRGGTLRENIVPLPTKEPSRVLLDLALGMLQSGKELASITDVMLGEAPGANVPATTVIALIEQGSKVRGSIVKRLYRSMQHEYQKLFILNSIYLKVEEYYRVLDDPAIQEIGLSDYDVEDIDVAPVADPSMTSKAQKMAIAQALLETWDMEPQSERQTEILKSYYQVVDPNNATKLMPKEDKGMSEEEQQQMQQANEAMQLELDAMKAELVTKQADAEKKIAETEKIEAETEKIEAETEQTLKEVDHDETGYERVERESNNDRDMEKDGDGDNGQDAGIIGRSSFGNG